MKIKYFLSALTFGFLLSTVIFSCSKSSGTGSSQSPGGNGGSGVIVDMSGMSYSPSALTVKAGTTIKWINSDIYSAHTVTSNDNASFNSGNIAIGASFSYTPSVPGTFPYHCTIHGLNMSGTLTVTN